MNEQMLTAYNSLPEVGQREAYDFVMFLSKKWEGQALQEKKANALFEAFEDAKVCVPMNWNRDEINERM